MEQPALVVGSKASSSATYHSSVANSVTSQFNIQYCSNSAATQQSNINIAATRCICATKYLSIAATECSSAT